MNFSKKLWSSVELGLIDLDSENGFGYYAGGTLMLPYGNKREVGLNLDGNGFVLSSPSPEHRKNNRVVQPIHITELVRKSYLKFKGYTPYFSTTVTGNFGNMKIKNQ